VIRNADVLSADWVVCNRSWRCFAAATERRVHFHWRTTQLDRTTQLHRCTLRYLLNNRVTSVQTVVTCEIKLFRNNLEINSAFYFTCNNVWK